MLVLARKLNESIVIGDNIIIKVIAIEKGVVKIGIEAPSDITILRSELIADVTELNIAASKEIKSESVTLLSKILRR